MALTKSRYRANALTVPARLSTAASPEPVKQYRRRTPASPSHNVSGDFPVPNMWRLVRRHVELAAEEGSEDEACIAEFLAKRELSRTQLQEQNRSTHASATLTAHECQTTTAARQQRAPSKACHASGVPQPSSRQQLQSKAAASHDQALADLDSCHISSCTVQAKSGYSVCANSRLSCRCHAADSEPPRKQWTGHHRMQAEMPSYKPANQGSLISSTRQSSCTCNSSPVHTNKPVLTYSAALWRRRKAVCIQQHPGHTVNQQPRHQPQPSLTAGKETPARSAVVDSAHKQQTKNPQQTSAITLTAGNSSNRIDTHRLPSCSPAGVHKCPWCRSTCEARAATYSSMRSAATSKASRLQTWSLLGSSSTAAYSTQSSRATACCHCSSSGQQKTSHLSAVKAALLTALETATAANQKAADVLRSTTRTATMSPVQSHHEDDPLPVDDTLMENIVTGWYRTPEDISTSGNGVNKELKASQYLAAEPSSCSTWSEGSHSCPRCISGLGYSRMQRKLANTWATPFAQQQQQKVDANIRQLHTLQHLSGGTVPSRDPRVVKSSPGSGADCSSSVKIAVFAGVDAVVPELIQASSSILDQLQHGLGGLRVAAARLSSADDDLMNIPLRHRYQ